MSDEKPNILFIETLTLTLKSGLPHANSLKIFWFLTPLQSSIGICLKIKLIYSDDKQMLMDGRPDGQRNIPSVTGLIKTTKNHTASANMARLY